MSLAPVCIEFGFLTNLKYCHLCNLAKASIHPFADHHMNEFQDMTQTNNYLTTCQ